jgi:uncharacterized protein YndB with AHSA1/START domain
MPVDESTAATHTEEKPTFVYVTYIKTTAEKVWQALTDGPITRQYWGGQQNVSDWQVGSEWRHESALNPANVDGLGSVVESDRPRRLVVTWAMPADAADPAKHSRVTYDIAEDQGVVRLTVTEDPFDPSSGAGEGWPKVLAGLKTLLETGQPLPSFWDRARDGTWQMLRFG